MIFEFLFSLVSIFYSFIFILTKGSKSILQFVADLLMLI